jgi:hypothetical protein
MAGCERGYLCAVCGQDVEEITDSELYLRYVLGDVQWEALDRAPERHIRCNPILAQFIVDEAFAAIEVEGAFAKAQLDPDFVKAEEARMTAGYLRLRELGAAGGAIWEYPLRDALTRRADDSLESKT